MQDKKTLEINEIKSKSSQAKANHIPYVYT